MMNGANSSWLKPIAWILLAALVGVYLLYDWYAGRLDAQLSEKDAQIAETIEQVKDREDRFGRIQEQVTHLNQQLAELTSQHSLEKQQLEDQMAATEQAKSQLEDDMEALRGTHAEALAAEQARTAQAIEERDERAVAYRELRRLFEEGQEQIVTLKKDLSEVRQAIADSTAEHREQVAELERHLNERVRLAKATPKDADLMRAAQAAGLLPETAALDEEAQGLVEQLAETQAALAALQAEYEAAQGTHREQLAALEQELTETRDGIARAGSDAAAALEDAYAAQLADAEARIAALSEQLEESPRPDVVAEIQERLERTEAELAQVSAEAEARILALTEQIQQSHAPEDFAALKERLVQAELEITQTRREAHAALSEAKTEQARQAKEGEAKISALSEQLSSEQAAAAKLMADRDDVIAELKESLSNAKEELASVQEALGAARAAAEDAGDRALDEARQRIAALEAAIEDERRQSAEAQSALRAETEQAMSSVRGLYQRFSELGATHTDRGMLLKLADTELRFEPGMASLTDADMPSLDRIAALLADHPKLSARVEGHTDSLGDEETNLALSQQRAEAVKAALIERGVEAGRLSAEGVGPARPIADNATPVGRAQNRRVEVYVDEG
jgi:outer membrane protein OmpA-like peptidoglycan-associated protein